MVELEELEKRLNRFYNQYSPKCAAEEAALAMKVAQSDNGHIRFLRLYQEQIHKEFHGYNSEEQDYNKSTYRQGKIGIHLEYFKNRSKELKKETIQYIFEKNQCTKDIYFKTAVPALTQHMHQWSYNKTTISNVIASFISSCGTEWDRCNLDLMHALEVLLDKINLEKQQVQSNLTMNVTAVNGVNVFGNGNTVNAQFGELCKALDSLGENISKCSKITEEEKQDFYS